MAIKNNPNFVEAYSKRGLIYNRIKNYSKDVIAKRIAQEFAIDKNLMYIDNNTNESMMNANLALSSLDSSG